FGYKNLVPDIAQQAEYIRIGFAGAGGQNQALGIEIEHLVRLAIVAAHGLSRPKQTTGLRVVMHPFRIRQCGKHNFRIGQDSGFSRIRDCEVQNLPSRSPRLFDCQRERVRTKPPICTLREHRTPPNLSAACSAGPRRVFDHPITRSPDNQPSPSHARLALSELPLRMRILTRYILGEVVSHALIGAAVFTFVLFTRDLGRILELVVRNSAPLPSIAEVFFFTVPVALTYTIPMGVLVGILIGLSRLAADSEITAMRASGLGVWYFLRVISIFVIVAWLLALGNSVYLAPRSLASLGQLQDTLKSSQASFEVQPRVFYEGFPKKVLYVQDAKAISGGALWKGVFLADLTDPSAPSIILAREGLLVSQGPDTLDLHLTNGSTHETDPKNPDQYTIDTFEVTDLPIQVPSSQANQEHEPTSLGEVKFSDLLRIAPNADPATRRWNLIEYHRRLSLPTACIVLALVGIPLGLSSKKGGKSSGFVLTILLVFLYYSLSLIGVSLARQGRVSPFAGVWLADFLFFIGGVFLLWQSERRPIELTAIRSWFGPSRVSASWFKLWWLRRSKVAP